jgi:hypothetical protein
VPDRSPKTRARLVLLLAGSLLLFAPHRVVAQATRADSAAILLDAASRLERVGRTEAALDLYRMILDRFGDTVAGDRVRQLLQSPGGRSTRSGRVELQVWSTLYGLWLGVAVPAAFGADGPEPYGVGLLVGGPIGFLAGMGLARSREFTDGQTRAITFGGTWGTWQGFGWSEVFDWGDGLQCEGDQCVSDGGPEEKFAGMILGGLTGIGVGLALSGQTITDGVATSVSLGSLWGSWFGLSLGVIADLENDDLLAAVLLGGNGGLVGSAVLASRTGISRGRARLISIAGVIGGLAGGGIDLITQPDGDKTLIAIPLIGSVVGLTIGAVTTRNFDRSPVGGDPDAGPDALFRIDGGRFEVDTPTPWLTLESANIAGRTTRRPALGLTLLRARF